MVNQNPESVNLSNEAKAPSEHIQESSVGPTCVTSLVRIIRPNALLVVILAIEVAHFSSSMIDVPVLIRTVLAFPAAYILPGFVLKLLTKSNHSDLPNLLVESFVISTIANVLTLSILILLNAQHYYFLLPLSQLLLVVIVAVLMKLRNDLPKLSISRVDGLVILVCFVVYLLATTIYSLTPRLLTPDETNYVINARYALLNGKVYDVGAWSSTSAFTYLVKGRFFWTLLTASFLASTGLEPYSSYLLGPMFLIMTALASIRLLPENFRRQGVLRFSTTAVLLTNPLLFYFSGFILNDLALAFYITFALALFVNSFRQNRFGESIHVLELILCFSVLFLVMVFIKTNMAIFLSMYVVLLFFTLGRRIRVVYRRFSYVLLIIPILYELLIDIPYNLLNWFLKNEFFGQLFSRILWVSPLQYFLGVFIARPWDSTTLFSHNASEYLQLIYTMISPEVLGLLFASITLAAPLTLILKWIRKDQKMLILALVLATTLPILYCAFLSGYSFRDLPRLGLFTIPIIVAFSSVIVMREISEHNVSTLLMFCLPAIVLLWLFAILSIQVDYGVYFYYNYGTPLLNWTINLVAPQLIIYVLVLSIMLVRRTEKISLRFPFAKPNWVKHVSFSKILYSTLITAIIIQNVYVSSYCLMNSSFFGQGHGLEDTNRILENADDKSLIFSNTYIYMRNYVSDDVLSEGRLFPPPKTENEFLQLLNFAPNGSLLVISTDIEVAWLEYANDYIQKYSDRDVIVSNTSNAYAIRIRNEQLSTGRISVFRTVNSITSDGGSSQVIVNEARLVRLSNQEKVLELNVSSPTSCYVKTLVGTKHFVELFNITLHSSNDVVKLGGGPDWQQESKVRVFIEDQNGNVVYDEEVHMFDVENNQLSFTLIIILFLSVFLFLTRRSEPVRTRAYPLKQLDAERIRTKRAI